MAYFLAWSAVYDVDKILVAAVLSLTQSELHRNLPAITGLRAAVIKHINVRVMMALEPPADWQRDSQITCDCQDCTALKSFLDDPTQPKWTLKAVEARRKHVEQIIKQHPNDVNCATQRIGSPHTLICTKNQASYQRRVDQRTHDLNVLTSLSAV
ncbi:hypothetical protein [Methylobacter psychrophilus]|uniref:hypothetical protein n=1 Tax=Methylobacter psychrophilus TaxID=96941 RepID=UPI0021D49BF2|nr:hypothetical protein [Methylobacter psychrophilus]